MPTTFFLKTNFGRGTLNAGITDVATSMTLNAGHTLPLVTGDHRVVLYDAVTYPYPDDDPNMEIVTANWTSGDTYAITRAQEGTTGVAHSASDRVSNMVTKGSIEELEAAINARPGRADPEVITGAWDFDGLVRIADTSKDHYYSILVSELTGNRNVTLPLLTGNDIFTFNDFAATLTNKTINRAANTITVNLADVTDITASLAEVNLLDLSGLSVGQVLRATGASAAAWQSILEVDITDGTLLARMAAAEIVTGAWRFDNVVWIQKTSIEALLVGKDSDGGNVLVVDTTNSLVSLGGVAPVIGCCLLLPLQNDAVTPTLSFGDGNSGFYEQSDNVVVLSLAGVASVTFDAAWFFSSSNAAGWAIVDETPSATNPIFTFRGDTDTGFTRAGVDTVGLVAGAISAIQYAEVSNGVIATEQIITGIGAFAGGGQGSATQLISSVNDITVCATAGDSVKLPVLTIGTRITVVNQGAASCDVFPSTGASINAGADNAAEALAVGTGVTYMGVTGSTWITV